MWFIPPFVTIESLPQFLTKRLVLFSVRFFYILFLSISVRECWHIIKQTSSAMIAFIAVKEISESE